MILLSSSRMHYFIPVVKRIRMEEVTIPSRKTMFSMIVTTPAFFVMKYQINGLFQKVVAIILFLNFTLEFY